MAFENPNGYDAALAFWQEDAIPQEKYSPGATTGYVAARLEIDYNYPPEIARGIAEATRRCAAYLQYREIYERNNANG